MQTLTIKTPDIDAFVDVTEQLRRAVAELELQRGALLVYCPHTTAGVTINEGADPSVVRDIQADLRRLYPKAQSYYRHAEGNSSSHSRASIVGSSVWLIVDQGELALGTWQSVFLCEFDGPRTRRLLLQPIDQIDVD